MMVNKASMVGGPLAVALPNIADGLRRHRFALLAALVLNIGDLLSTHVGLANGLPEGNLIPAMLHASGDFQRLIRSPVLSRDQQAKVIGMVAERAGLSAAPAPEGQMEIGSQPSIHEYLSHRHRQNNR